MIPLPFLATSVVAATALLHSGSEAQKQRLLPPAIGAPIIIRAILRARRAPDVSRTRQST